MGAEITLIIIVIVLAAGAFMFFSGTFGVGKAARERERSSGGTPRHAYVENETSARSPGSDEKEQVKERAVSDPDTEVRER